MLAFSHDGGADVLAGRVDERGGDGAGQHDEHWSAKAARWCASMDSGELNRAPSDCWLLSQTAESSWNVIKGDGD